MNIEDAQKRFERQIACEFYSSGKDWVAWLDEGWHRGTIVALDMTFPCVTLHISMIGSNMYTIIVEVRGVDDMIPFRNLSSKKR